MDLKVQVGNTAGKIWHFLNDNGPQTVAQLKKKLNSAGDLVGLALGWLSREDKIHIFQEKRSLKVALK